MQVRAIVSKFLPHTPKTIARSAHFPGLCKEYSTMEAEGEFRR